MGKKLRIQKMAYTNQGTANISLKGVKEYHAIFKFDTDKEAEGFIRKVKEWYSTIEEVTQKVKHALLKHELSQESVAILKDKSDEVKKPIPEKRKAGRPAKANIQG